jgi:arylsulfatase A-like enzyme
MDGKGINRRDFNKATMAAVGAAALPDTLVAPGRQAGQNRARPYNIVLVMCDQESYHLQNADGYELPARDELRRRGIAFEKHYIGAAMCTPSRGVMFSGHPPQINGVFDQMELGYVPSLDKRKPSMGTVMRELGYATAYYGKFELRRDIIYPKDTVNYSDALVEYGFDAFAPDGDKVGAPDQGYDTDEYTVAEGNRWLRTHAGDLNRQNKPWFLMISMVSPHDIMYADANPPGQQVQVSQVGAEITKPPANSVFGRKWKFPLSASRLQSLSAPGRPGAGRQYLEGWSYWLGTIPAQRREMWEIFYNYYLNLIRDNDQTLGTLLATLGELRLWDDTIVIFTADHGELAGSHGGLRGKGPFPYEQETHVPFVVVHPDYPGPAQCQAVTSHIDLLPTLAGLTGLPQPQRRAATSGMPGKDFSPLLARPHQAAADAVRPGALFNYVGLQTIDANYLKQIAPLQAHGKPAPPLAQLHPDLGKRGFVNFVFDGQYKFARYYAPNAFNTPRTLEEIFRWNDCELFDLESDPHEMTNLATEPMRQLDLILRLNELLNALLEAEVGSNDGQFLPAAVRPRGPARV